MEYLSTYWKMFIEIFSDFNNFNLPVLALSWVVIVLYKDAVDCMEMVETVVEDNKSDTAVVVAAGICWSMSRMNSCWRTSQRRKVAMVHRYWRNLHQSLDHPRILRDLVSCLTCSTAVLDNSLVEEVFYLVFLMIIFSDHCNMDILSLLSFFWSSEDPSQHQTHWCQGSQLHWRIQDCLLEHHWT